MFHFSLTPEQGLWIAFYDMVVLIVLLGYVVKYVLEVKGWMGYATKGLVALGVVVTLFFIAVGAILDDVEWYHLLPPQIAVYSVMLGVGLIAGMTDDEKEKATKIGISIAANIIVSFIAIVGLFEAGVSSLSLSAMLIFVDVMLLIFIWRRES